MTARTTDYDRPELLVPWRDELPYLAAAQLVPAGAMVVANAAGYSENATAAAAKIVQGVCAKKVDNSAGAAGDLPIVVVRGIFLFANKAGDLLTQADVGGTAYIEDNDTVRKTSASTSAAGKVRAVTTAGVWVEVGIN